MECPTSTDTPIECIERLLIVINTLPRPTCLTLLNTKSIITISSLKGDNDNSSGRVYLKNMYLIVTRIGLK